MIAAQLTGNPRKSAHTTGGGAGTQSAEVPQSGYVAVGPFPFGFVTFTRLPTNDVRAGLWNRHGSLDTAAKKVQGEVVRHGVPFWERRVRALTHLLRPRPRPPALPLGHRAMGFGAVAGMAGQVPELPSALELIRTVAAGTDNPHRWSSSSGVQVKFVRLSDIEHWTPYGCHTIGPLSKDGS